jgi:hypothetical protein
MQKRKPTTAPSKTVAIAQRFMLFRPWCLSLKTAQVLKFLDKPFNFGETSGKAKP